MMRVPCVLLALAAALVLASAQTDLEQQVEKLIENFRAIMPTGRADINIPILDPATIAKFPITVNLSPFNAQCVASDVKVKNVSGFKFTRLEQIEESNSLAVSVTLPDIDVNGLYDLQGNVKIGFIKINLIGNGNLTLVLKGLKGDATVDVQVNSDGTLNLANLTINSWTYDQITINLANLLNGGVLGDTVNKLVNKLAPTFINANKAKINGIVETLGEQFINQYLDGVNGKENPSALHLRVEKAAHLTLSHDQWTVTAEMQEILDQLAAAAISLAPKHFSRME